MGAIDNDWLIPLKSEFSKPYYAKLYRTIRSEYESGIVYPAPDDIFSED